MECNAAMLTSKVNSVCYVWSFPVAAKCQASIVLSAKGKKQRAKLAFFHAMLCDYMLIRLQGMGFLSSRWGSLVFFLLFLVKFCGGICFCKNWTLNNCGYVNLWDILRRGKRLDGLLTLLMHVFWFFLSCERLCALSSSSWTHHIRLKWEKRGKHMRFSSIH